MKNSIITLSLSLAFAFSQIGNAANVETLSSNAKKIDTIVVVSQQEPANFEVYSLRHAESAMDNSINMMVDSLDKRFANEAATMTEFGTVTGSAI